jgi:acetyl esterase/lipase
VLIFFHGGGFVVGDKSVGARFELCRECVEAGISVVSANYRFARTGRDGSPGEPHPGSILDGARAVQFVRSKAAEWNLDPQRVALSGGSAGAVMAMWIGFHDELAEPEGDEIAKQSTRVSCVLPYNGPTSLEPAVILKHVGGRPDIHPSMNDFYGIQSMDEMEKPEKAALARDASALFHLTADDPPVYASYGGTLTDAPLPADASHGKSIHHPMFGKLLKDRCEELGVRCVFTCRDVPAETTAIDFVKDVFGVE